MEGTKIGSIAKDRIVKNAKGKEIAFLRQGGILEDANSKSLVKSGKMDGPTTTPPDSWYYK